MLSIVSHLCHGMVFVNTVGVTARAAVSVDVVVFLAGLSTAVALPRFSSHAILCLTIVSCTKKFWLINFCPTRVQKMKTCRFQGRSCGGCCRAVGQIHLPGWEERTGCLGRWGWSHRKELLGAAAWERGGGTHLPCSASSCAFSGLAGDWCLFSRPGENYNNEYSNFERRSRGKKYFFCFVTQLTCKSLALAGVSGLSFIPRGGGSSWGGGGIKSDQLGPRGPLFAIDILLRILGCFLWRCSKPPSSEKYKSKLLSRLISFAGQIIYLCRGWTGGRENPCCSCRDEGTSHLSLRFWGHWQKSLALHRTFAPPVNDKNIFKYIFLKYSGI